MPCWTSILNEFKKQWANYSRTQLRKAVEFLSQRWTIMSLHKYARTQGWHHEPTGWPLLCPACKRYHLAAKAFSGPCFVIQEGPFLSSQVVSNYSTLNWSFWTVLKKNCWKLMEACCCNIFCNNLTFVCMLLQHFRDVNDAIHMEFCNFIAAIF